MADAAILYRVVVRLGDDDRVKRSGLDCRAIRHGDGLAILSALLAAGLPHEAIRRPSPALVFMVRAAVSIRHEPFRGPLDLLAGFRPSSTARPIESALQDMKRIADGVDPGDRLLSRLRHVAGDRGVNLHQVALLLLSLGEGEKPEDWREIVGAHAIRAWEKRRMLGDEQWH